MWDRDCQMFIVVVKTTVNHFFVRSFFSKIAFAALFWVVLLSIDVWKNRVNGNCLASQILTYE